jgi:hypothetical protein
VLRATRTARQDGTPRGGRLDFTLRQRF